MLNRINVTEKRSDKIGDMDSSILRNTRNSSLVVKKWTSFVAAIWVMAISGTNFDFSDYSSTLKKIMNINQIKLNNLAVASDLGKLMGWVSGLVCLVLPTWAVLAIAVSLGMVGYGVQWLIISEIIQPLPYWLVYILCMLAGNSICWLNTVCFRVAISNFPTKKGIASGLSTSYVGLSTVIYTNLSSVIDPGNPSLYLLLNSVVPVVVCAIAALFLNVAKPNTAVEDEKDQKNMYIFTFIAIITAIYSIVYEFLPTGKRMNEGLYLGVLILLLLVLLYVPLKAALGLKRLKRNASSRVTNLDIILSVDMHNPSVAGYKWEQYIEEISRVELYGDNKEPSILSHQNSKDSNPMNNLDQKPNETEIVTMEHIESGIHPPVNTEISSTNNAINTGFLSPVPALGEEHSILQLLRSVDFWLYYFVYFCGGTVGLVYINNLGQIIQSLGYSKTPVLVSLVSSLGFLGRIASGLPDYFKNINRGLPRPAWLGIWMMPMVLAFFLLAFSDPRGGILYACTAIIGTSAGAITSVAVPTSSELFGMERFGVNHNILISNIAFGSLLFGDMAGLVYDQSASSLDMNSSHGVTEDGRHLCLGKDCYAKTFMAWGCVCLFGLVLCVILSLRTRRLYKALHKQHCSNRAS
eukprot:Gb_01515 [translate_table: standard]